MQRLCHHWVPAATCLGCQASLSEQPAAPRHSLYPLLPLTKHWVPRGERIRVTEHPLEIHLLFAVGTRLLLPDDAPAPDAELVKPGKQHVKGNRLGWRRGDRTERGGNPSRLNKVTPTPLCGGHEPPMPCMDGHVAQPQPFPRRRKHLPGTTEGAHGAVGWGGITRAVTNAPGTGETTNPSPTVPGADVARHTLAPGLG